jgi:hypothetical protein
MSKLQKQNPLYFLVSAGMLGISDKTSVGFYGDFESFYRFFTDLYKGFANVPPFIVLVVRGRCLDLR